MVGVGESFPSLVYGVVVGQGGVGDACTAEAFRPFGFSAEDKLLAYRCVARGERAFQVDDHGIGFAEGRAHAFEQAFHALTLNPRAYASVEQHVAREEDGQRAFFPRLPAARGEKAEQDVKTKKRS